MGPQRLFHAARGEPVRRPPRPPRGRGHLGGDLLVGDGHASRRRRWAMSAFDHHLEVPGAKPGDAWRPALRRRNRLRGGVVAEKNKLRPYAARDGTPFTAMASSGAGVGSVRRRRAAAGGAVGEGGFQRVGVAGPRGRWVGDRGVALGRAGAEQPSAGRPPQRIRRSRFGASSKSPGGTVEQDKCGAKCSRARAAPSTRKRDTEASGLRRRTRRCFFLRPASPFGGAGLTAVFCPSVRVPFGDAEPGSVCLPRSRMVGHARRRASAQVPARVRSGWARAKTKRRAQSAGPAGALHAGGAPIHRGAPPLRPGAPFPILAVPATPPFRRSACHGA